MAIEKVNSTDEFKQLVKDIKNQYDYKEAIAFGISRVDCGQKNSDKVLQANYVIVNFKENYGSEAIFIKALSEAGIKVDTTASDFTATINSDFLSNAMNAFAPYIDEATGDAHKNVQVIKALSKIDDLDNKFKITFIFEDTNPTSVEAVYLKLYALSLGKAELRGLNLNGAFGILSNVAWVGNTPYELEYLRDNEIEMKLNGTYPNVDSVDKFPRFLQHIIPADNTRILDSSKVRMGAQLAAGTTVMPGASYINFNAGTLGAVMVEGRISSSAIVGAGSDVGGGASILGVLSGTDGNPISVGKNTLLGANSVTGMPIGDGCILDAGVTILEGTKVKIDYNEIRKIEEVNPDNILCDDELYMAVKELDKEIEGHIILKAKQLMNLNGIHFRQNSTTGETIAQRSVREIKLNDELH